MPSVEFVDHSERVKALIQRKADAMIAAAASQLVVSYHRALSDPAPPHSVAGEMPHAYFGHKTGGYGPVHGVPGSVNNTNPPFATTQTDFLYKYIQSSGGKVGFAPSHVTSRRMNYLLAWETGQYFRATDSFARRPWVFRAFRENRQSIIDAALNAARTEGTT